MKNAILANKSIKIAKEGGQQGMRWLEWHHQLNGHKFEQAPGVGDGQGSLVRCSPWGLKESDMTERLNYTELKGGGLSGERCQNIPQYFISKLLNLKKKIKDYYLFRATDVF